MTNILIHNQSEQDLSRHIKDKINTTNIGKQKHINIYNKTLNSDNKINYLKTLYKQSKRITSNKTNNKK